MAEEISEP